jgi:hypothetical protein
LSVGRGAKNEEAREGEKFAFHGRLKRVGCLVFETIGLIWGKHQTIASDQTQGF